MQRLFPPCLVILFFGCLPFLSWATTYNCSTVAEIRTAMASAVAGDEIVIAPGTYTATNVAGSGTSAHYYGAANGTASNPIIIRSQSATNQATLRGNSTSSLTVLRIVGDYWVVKDLKITRAQKGLIFDNANHCEAINCEVWDIGFEGIHVRDGSDYTTIDDCYIHHTGTVNAGFGEGIYIGTDKGSWSTYDPYVDYTTVKNCTIGPQVKAEAFDIKEGTSETVVEYCTVDATGISGSNFADSFIDLKGTRTYVRYCTFSRNGASNLTKGIAVIDRGVALSSYEHAVHDNTFNMDISSGNMLEAYSGTSDVYGWNNTRNPSGDNYNSRVTTSCCPPWYSPGSPPPPPTCADPSGLSTSGVTTSEVTFNWSAVSGASDYDLRYRESGTTGWTNVNNLSSTSRTETGLTASTTYEWQVRADCGSNQSAYVSGSDVTTNASGGGSGGSGTTTVIYDDALATDWNNYSYSGTYDFSHSTNVQVGSNAIEAVYGSYGGINLKPDTDLDVSNMASIRFWVKGNGAYLIRLRLGTDAGTKNYEFTTTTSWQQLTVAMSEFDSPSEVDQLVLQNRSGSSWTVYYDQIEFVENSSPRLVSFNLPEVNPIQWTVAPNPFSGRELQLHLTEWTTDQPTEMTLFNSQGQLLMRRSLQLFAGQTLVHIPLEKQLPAGSYFVRLQSPDIQEQRILIVR